VNWEFVRREWGAVTFVITVVVGMVIVPLALFFANQGPGPVIIPPVHTASTPASGARTATPAHTNSPSPSPSPSK
jgi:quinol-cytochrome oxidoreductase complex cytochrome b subunit